MSLGKRFPRLLQRQGLESPRSWRTPGCCGASQADQRLLLGVVGVDQLERLVAKLFDEAEFLSPYGLRALSAYHRDHPYELDVEGTEATIDYEPAESTTDMFGGNSNWRGPIWFPLNYLVLESLERYYRFFGEELQIEYPTGSGQTTVRSTRSPPTSASAWSRSSSSATDGRRPCFGGTRRCRPTPPGRTT